MAASDSDVEGDALEVFAGWLSRREQGEGVELEDLLLKHPGLRAELVELEATWRRLSEASDPAESLSLQERIKNRFGDESLAEVSLERPPRGESEAELGSHLIARLSSPGQRFRRYRIRGEVGRGGMGVVHMIWDEELRRYLAMKVIRSQVEARAGGTTPPVESWKVARFLEEAQVTSQLEHPGIVPVHELGLDPQGGLYFTMKLVKGESLLTVFDHVRAGRNAWSQARALSVLLKICEAMAYAHDKGVIHRDLKPANVMVGKFGEVHVMDWGLARISGREDRKDIRISSAEPGSAVLTMDGEVVGTPNYMPPEQAAGRVGEVGPHSDVYALGAMLYHLAAGHPPYHEQGVRPAAREVLAGVRRGPPRPIADLAPQLPAELVAICERAMAWDWKERYRDMSELAADLSAYLDGRVVRAYETGTWAETKKWVQRNRGFAAALAGAILILVAGVVTSSILGLHASAEAAKALRGKQDVLKLAAFQTLDELRSRADALWPARPELIAGYRQWIEDAELLLARLPGLRATLADIEARALPQSEAERARERAAHPRAQELEQTRALSLWTARMLGRAPWPSESQVEAELAQEGLPGDTQALLGIAAELMNPESPVLGSEVRALLIARRALAAASAEERAVARARLGQAYGRLGRFDEALAEAGRALEEGDPARKSAFETFRAGVEEFAATWRSADGRIPAAQLEAADQLASEVALLESEIARRRDWRFPPTPDGEAIGDQWWHAQLQRLIDELELLGDGERGLVRGLSETHGLGVSRRLELATSIHERSQTGEIPRRLWSEAIDEIAASAAYRDAEWPGEEGLKPQLGLLPLGPDPESSLWEFADVQTGEIPVRGEDGRLVVTEEMGLVFVLLPGGSFWMGSQPTDPQGQNYDPKAQPDEQPVHRVTLSPFLLSKYEMTQGQWLRIAGNNPSQFAPGGTYFREPNDLRHPVERVDFFACAEMCKRLGLALPSEAQWEYACRAGTQTPWWTGPELESLNGRANLGDQAAKRVGMKWFEPESWPSLEDGWPLHAPVGSFGANGFGLHEIIGNVWEVCGDERENYSIPDQVDPFQPWQGGTHELVGRGGGFGDPGLLLRSAHRDSRPPDTRGANVGVRPARAIEG